MNGKFSNVKKALAAIVCICMLAGCMSIGVFAADADPETVVFTRPEIEQIEADQIGMNYIYVTVSASGSSNDQPVVVYLTDGGSNCISLGYAPINASAARVKIGIPDSVPTGRYTLVATLNNALESVKDTVFYIGVEDVEGLFEIINTSDADVQEIKEKIDLYCEALAVVESTMDYKLVGDTYNTLSEDAKYAFAELILNAVNGKYSYLKGRFNAENAERFVKEAFILASYNAKGFTNKQIADIIYGFTESLGIANEDGETTVYDEIRDRETFVKALKTMLPAAENIEELRETLKNAAAVQIVNEAHWSNLVNVVSQYNDLFNVDEAQLNKLLKTKSLRTIFCEQFNKTYYSIDEIRKSWASTYKNALKEYDLKSSGSSSGGSTSVSVKTNVVSTQVSQDENKRDENVKTGDYYNDMTGYAWASDAVFNLTKAQIISGYGDNTFRPGNSVTRAEFMKMVVNVFGFADINAACSFTDVDKDAWYYIYVASAEKAGIAQGYGNGLFGVGDSITRQDALTIIYRAAKAKGLSLEKFKSGLGNLTDRNDIAYYAVEAVEALYNTGIYLDSNDTTVVTRFDPEKYASRAYLAYILNQIYIYMN